MTFQIIESSRQKGEPVTLYRFVYDADMVATSPPTGYFGYTDAEQEIVASGYTYDPIPIMRDPVTSSGSLDRVTLNVRMPRTVEFALLFRVYPPSQVVTLIIYQGHLSDPDDPDQFMVIWSGRVLSVGRDGDECKVTCEPVASSLRRPGLRRHYQYGCPHVLYGDECRANRPASSVAGTVASVSGTSATLAPGWNGGFTSTRFNQGTFEWYNDDGALERRKILNVSGNTLALGGLLRDLNIGDPVVSVLGCAHNMTDCTLFANVNNFGGCPWIPTKNPVSTYNHFY